MSLTKEEILQLKNEIIMAEKLNEQELAPIVMESMQRYMGIHVPQQGANWDFILNEVYPIVQAYLPAVFFQNPRAFLKPREKTFIAKVRDPLSGKMTEIEKDSAKSAKTQEAILNYMISEINYKKEARRCLLDAFLFPHAVMWRGYKGDFGMTEEQNIWVKDDQVFVKRINPMRFIKDPFVNMSNMDEGRWVARIIDVPWKDFIEDDKLDIDKKLIKGFQGYGQKVGTQDQRDLQANGAASIAMIASARKPLLDYTDSGFKTSKLSHFVRIYEIFIRASKKEKREGKKGKIILWTKEQEKPLRESEWKIKAEGFPANILSFNELPDSAFNLSDVDTYKVIADQKNAILNLALRNATENTKVWIGISKEGANEEDITRVQEGTNSIITFEGGKPADRMYVASPGGAASNELYMALGQVDRSLQEKSGITDLRRGVPPKSGEESATSVKIRTAGDSARPAYRQDIMAEFVKNDFHYLNQLIKQFVTIDEAVRIQGSLDLEWSDDPSEEDIQADVDVEIDVISMLPENPDKEIAELNAVLTLIVSGLTNPAIAQKLQQEGKTMNLAPVIEQLLMRMRIKDPNIFRNIDPKEGMGFVSVEQLNEARDNVTAAITGQQIPHPPSPNDDHVAKLEIYTTIQNLLKMANQTSDMLEQLIQIQSQLLQQQQEEQAKPGNQPSLKKGGVLQVAQK